MNVTLVDVKLQRRHWRAIVMLLWGVIRHGEYRIRTRAENVQAVGLRPRHGLFDGREIQA